MSTDDPNLDSTNYLLMTEVNAAKDNTVSIPNWLAWLISAVLIGITVAVVFMTIRKS